MSDALGRLRTVVKRRSNKPIDSELKKVMMELTKWRKFDKLMQKKFKENFHMGETHLNIAEYMEAQLQLSLIGEKAKRDQS